MGNLLLGWNNLAKTSTITVNTSAAGLDGSQMVNDQGSPSSAWQTVDGFGAINLDAGKNVIWRAFGLFRTNLTSTAIIRLLVFDADGVTIAFDTGYPDGNANVVAGYGQCVIVAPSDVSGRYVRIYIHDFSNPDGFINIPLLYAGPALQPSRNFDYQSVPGRSNQLVRADARAGGATLRSDWIKRTFDLSLSSLTPTELMAVQDMDFAARQGSNVLLIPNPDAPTINRDALFGEMLPSAGFGYGGQSGRVRSYRAMMTERL